MMTNLCGHECLFGAVTKDTFASKGQIVAVKIDNDNEILFWVIENNTRTVIGPFMSTEIDILYF